MKNSRQYYIVLQAHKCIHILLPSSQPDEMSFDIYIFLNRNKLMEFNACCNQNTNWYKNETNVMAYIMCPMVM